MAESARQFYVSHAEIADPVPMRVDGNIPEWVNGNLVRIGPGLFEFGVDVAKYPMDGMGFLHSFSIQNGEATFRSKFLASNALKKNLDEKRLTMSEFGTAASPDPKKSMFAKFKAKVTGGEELSDNSNHFILYWPKFHVLLVPSSLFVFVIDPITLDTLDRVYLPESLGVDLISEHMQVDSDGTLYLLGSHVKGRPVYHIIKVPLKDDVKSSFAAAEKVFSVNGQFKVTPTAFHTFVMTENFFVLVESPMEINIMKILTKSTTMEAIQYDGSVSTKFHIHNRRTGSTIKHKMESEGFYLLHVINAYEESEHLVLDLLCFRKFSNKDLFVTRQNLNAEDYSKNKPWNKVDIHRPLRFVLPTNQETLAGGRPGDNLVSLTGEKAQAVVEKSHLQLKPRPLTKKGEDRLQYPAVGTSSLRRPYHYFYAGGCGESDFLQFGVGKFDVHTQECQTWEAEGQQYLGEPQFIAKPGSSSEEEGVLLFPLLDYSGGEEDRLVVVDSQSMTTLAQCFFTDSLLVLPEADHGSFVPINPENA